MTDLVDRPWVEAVYQRVSAIKMRENLSVRAVQVSPEWFENHDRPKTVWGLPIEVDQRLWGDGFRLVV